MVCVFSVSAQFRKIPAEVTDAFKLKYANASGVSWKDKISGFQADYVLANKPMKSMFSAQGTWMKTETKEDYKTIPTEIKDGFRKSKYADMIVLTLTKVEEKDKQTVYKMSVKKTDSGKKNLVFSNKGQLLSDSGIF